MLPLLNTLSFILRHPLNRGQEGRALARYLRWQVGSRLVSGKISVPFVNPTRLLIAPGMTGATQNIYCGLHEYEDMAFVLHALRKTDLFVDVGANVGSYTVLAGGAVGARCVAIEPLPSTFQHLLDNIRINGFETSVRACNVGVGARDGELSFSSSFDTTNHVLAKEEIDPAAVTVPVVTLDWLLRGDSPSVLKIDVEGYETQVLEGASDVMRQDSLFAVLVESNGSGKRYGFDESLIHRRMFEWGFACVAYLPHRRELKLLDSSEISGGGNLLYVRKLEEVRDRLQSAPCYEVSGRWL